MFDTNILDILADYNAVITGTIPIGIDVPESDADIICNAADLDEFKKNVLQNFSKYPFFCDKTETDRYIASFIYDGLNIEIYAENKPVMMQNAFRHMLVENRILKIAGSKFREEIIRLKTEGLKTEPAFGMLLNLPNPYDDLLKFEKLSDDELLRLIKMNCADNNSDKL